MSNFYKDVCPSFELNDGSKLNIPALMNVMPSMVDGGGVKNLWNLSDTVLTTYNTQKGIVYRNNEDSTFYVTGTSTQSDAYVNVKEYIDELPFGLQIGDTIVVMSNHADVQCCVIPRLSTGSYGSTVRGTLNNPGFYTIASNCTGLLLRMTVPTSGITVDANVSGILCKKDAWDASPKFTPYAPTNRELYEMIKDHMNILSSKGTITTTTTYDSTGLSVTLNKTGIWRIYGFMNYSNAKVTAVGLTTNTGYAISYNEVRTGFTFASLSTSALVTDNGDHPTIKLYAQAQTEANNYCAIVAEYLCVYP